MDWEAVIGLEIHVQLNTQSKIFSGSATAFGQAPNSQASAIDLGLPGVLPVLNKGAVKKALQFGLAIDAELNNHSVFARKNYFYPDLPKGYQISQFERPIVGRAKLTIQVGDHEKSVGITRAHLEEDAGKSLHEDFQGESGIDLNRAGIPLLEIVSEPDLRSAAEAVAYLKKIHSIVTYLKICDGNMAEGSLRCDANVSVRPVGQEEFGTRTEIKNVNSFRFVEKAIDYEIERQINVLESGAKVVQETRLYDANKNETRSMRSKEEANDYRYFPDPDLLPVAFDEAWVKELKQELPELADQKSQRYQEQFGLSEYDAQILTANYDTAMYFEAVLEHFSDNPKACANWVMGEVAAALNQEDKKASENPITAADLAQLIRRIDDNTLNSRAAKQVFQVIWEKRSNPEKHAVPIDVDVLINELGLKQVSDSGTLNRFVDEVIANNPDQVAQLQDGKTKVLGFLVGQVMKLSQGKANPGEVNKLIREKLLGE